MPGGGPEMAGSAASRSRFVLAVALCFAATWVLVAAFPFLWTA